MRKYQYGKMGMGAIIGLCVAGVFVLTIVAGIGNYYSAYGYGAEQDNLVKSKYENLENVLAQGTTKVKELAQVPGMKTDDLKDVMKGAMEGRYGENGSQAVFQWIQEAYPGQVSDELYAGISRAIEATRNEFKTAQTAFIGVKQRYQTNIDKDALFMKGWWLNIAGYPKINLEDYKTVSSTHAKKAFDTGVDDGVQLR